MQETHIIEEDNHLLEQKNRGMFCGIGRKEKMRGVVTYINKDLKPKLIKASKDGRFLFIEIYKDDKNIDCKYICPKFTPKNFFKDTFSGIVKTRM